MTYADAMAVKDRARRSQPVGTDELAAANAVIQATRKRMLNGGIPEPEPLEAAKEAVHEYPSSEDEQTVNALVLAIADQPEKRQKTLAEQVVAALHGDPKRRMAARDIVQVFKVDPNGIYARLQPAVEKGLLERFKDKDGVACWRLPQPQASIQPAAPAKEQRAAPEESPPPDPAPALPAPAAPAAVAEPVRLADVPAEQIERAVERVLERALKRVLPEVPPGKLHIRWAGGETWVDIGGAP